MRKLEITFVTGSLGVSEIGDAVLQASQTPGNERNVDLWHCRHLVRRSSVRDIRGSDTPVAFAASGRGNVLVARMGRVALRRDRNRRRGCRRYVSERDGARPTAGLPRAATALITRLIRFDPFTRLPDKPLDPQDHLGGAAATYPLLSLSASQLFSFMA